MATDSDFTPIREVGEFGLIDRMKTILGKPTNDDVLAGISDDAAVYRIDDDHVHVMTTDVLIEGVHFDRLINPMEYLGMKSIAVNVSDVVAMNAEPRYATVGLGLPETVSVEQVESFYQGMRKACERYGVTVVGGDTSAAHQLTISVTVVGEARTRDVVYRRGAAPGDLLCVTGDLGGAFAGLKILLRQRQELQERGDDFAPNVEEYQYVIQRHLVPTARLDVVRAWREAGVKPHALIDLSDGLGSDIHHVCTQSGCGAELHVAAVPVALETRRVADEFEEDVDTFALFGGEDYELLFAAARDDLEKIEDESYSVIGRFTAESDVTVKMPDGTTFPLGKGGYDHFRDESGT
ncbi:MAG: thiamine-phosphate kinase [Rhodothermales bacterium]